MRRESHAQFCERLAVKLRRATHLCMEIAAARILDAFHQNRPASFEDVAMIENYRQRPWMRPATN